MLAATRLRIIYLALKKQWKVLALKATLVETDYDSTVNSSFMGGWLFTDFFTCFVSCAMSVDGPSGFGFELTFRLRREPGAKSPPTWPAHLLQSLARYVFRSQAQLLPGDHIPWHCPLDQIPSASISTSGSSAPQSLKPSEAQQHQQQSVAMAAVAAAASLIATQAANQGEELIDPATYTSAFAAAVSAAQAEYVKRTLHKQQQKVATALDVISPKPEVSRIRHMLLVDDPQLAKINTPYGWVRFLQARKFPIK